MIDGTEIRFVQSNVEEIRADENKVILGKSVIDYDLLVICLGSNTKYFGIEGAKTNTIPLRSIDDAKLPDGRPILILAQKITINMAEKPLSEIADFLEIFVPEVKVPESIQSKSVALQVEIKEIISDLGLEVSGIDK